jgi:hypothetical protein
MQNHDNPHQVHREDAANTDQLRSVPRGDVQYSPEVEGAIPHQITNQTRLSACSARHSLVPPVHVDRPRDRKEEHKSIVSEFPRNIHSR